MDSGKLIADVLIHGFIIRREMKTRRPRLHNLALTNYSPGRVNRARDKARRDGEQDGLLLSYNCDNSAIYTQDRETDIFIFDRNIRKCIYMCVCIYIFNSFLKKSPSNLTARS